MKVKAGIVLLLILVTLGTITATIAMASESATTGSKVDINEIKENYAFIVRDFSKGISIDEIEKIRQNFVNKVKSKYPEKVVAFAVPDIPEGAKIVVYGIKIDRSGVINQYFGFAGDRESAEIIYKKAQKWYNKNVLESSEKSSSVKASASWVEIGRNNADYYVNPYGGVTNNFELRQLVNDGSSTYDWFAVKQIFAMEPGCQAYNSEWKNDRGYPTHDYSVSTRNPQLHDWDPLGSHTGQQTITVSITGGESGASATWSWSYTQPDVTTLDHSSTSTEIAKWEMQFNNNDVQTTTGGMKPGSSVRINQPSYGKYHLLDLISEGKFKKPVWWWYEYHTIKHTWHIYVEY
ncbi:hypothetical protein [Archaeoglobus sp.]